MADDVTTVRDLRVHVTENNEKAISFVIKFTTGPADVPGLETHYDIEIPRVIQTRLARLLEELTKNLANADDVVRDTVVDKDYRIQLQRVNSP
jgi:hypothetical protein